MNTFSGLLVPCIIALTAVFALYKKVDVFSAMITGAGEGLNVLLRIFPALVGLLTGVYMLRASGALDAVAVFLAPVMNAAGIPSEVMPLMVIRPVSGSGALAVGAELIQTYGPDSEVGRTAAVMLGSTETTFYVIAVYFGAIGVKRSRYAIPAALVGDIAGFIAAALAVRLFF